MRQSGGVVVSNLRRSLYTMKVKRSQGTVTIEKECLSEYEGMNCEREEIRGCYWNESQDHRDQAIRLEKEILPLMIHPQRSGLEEGVYQSKNTTVCGWKCLRGDFYLCGASQSARVVGVMEVVMIDMMSKKSSRLKIHISIKNTVAPALLSRFFHER